MKKVLMLVCICSLLAFSAISAMAADDGGHGGHVSPTVDVSLFTPVEIASSDVTAPWSVASAAGLKLEQVKAAVADWQISGYTTGYTPLILTGFNLALTENSANQSGNIVLASGPFVGLQATPTGALIKDKTQTSGNVFIYYSVTKADGKYTIKDVALTSHFSAADVILVEDVVTPSSGGSSGGCNAAAAPVMLLLAALPLLYMRKR